MMIIIIIIIIIILQIIIIAVYYNVLIYSMCAQTFYPIWKYMWFALCEFGFFIFVFTNLPDIASAALQY
jgi:hypothetical protein